MQGRSQEGRAQANDDENSNIETTGREKAEPTYANEKRMGFGDGRRIRVFAEERVVLPIFVRASYSVFREKL